MTQPPGNHVARLVKKFAYTSTVVWLPVIPGKVCDYLMVANQGDPRFGRGPGVAWS